MAEVKIWHNPRCRKSREGLQYLRDRGMEPEIFDYIKEGFDPSELVRVIQMTGQPLSDFIRRKEAEYRALGLKGKELTVEEFARIAAEHPKLLERPIVIKGNKAVLARPANRIDEIL